MSAEFLRRGWAAAAALALVAACGGASQDVVPRLPGDGDEHTAEPRDPRAGGAPDLWADRDLIPAPPPLEPRRIALPEIERFTLRSGLQVVAVKSDLAPTFHMQLAVRAGRRDEERGKSGVASFVASMLPRGARGRSQAQLTGPLEQAGGQLTSNASFEATLVTCHVVDRGRKACLDAVAAMVRAPSFPAAAMKEVREQLLTAARQSHLDPAQLANMHFQNALWGDEHVRGWPMSERSVAAIERADLVAWHKRHYTPKNSVLVVVSPDAPAKLRPVLERSLGSWRGAAPPAHEPDPAPTPSGIDIRLVDVPNLNQAHVRVGRTGLSHRDEDFYAATVVNHVLGGPSPRARLARAMRRSLSGRAAASSSFDRNVDVGAFVAAGVAPPADAVTLMRTLMDEIGRMAADGPTGDEVTAAITELAGGYQTRFESHQEIAGALLAAELHGFGPEYVRDFAVRLGAVDVAAARKSAARRLDGKNLVVVIAGNAQAIEPHLMEAGLRYQRVAHTAPIAKHERDERAAAQKPASPKEEAAARAILDAALAAKGGAGKLQAIKRLSWKGDAVLNLPNGKVPAKVQKRFVQPDKLRLDMEISMGGAKMSITTALVGDKGWAQERRPDGARTIDFPQSEVEAGQAQIWRDQDFVLLRHREKGAQVAPQPDVTIDGAAHHAIRVTSPDGKRSVVLLIDKKSRQLRGLNYVEQGVTAEERFGDYRAVGGVQFAHKRVTKSAQVDLTTTVTEVKVNPSIDSSAFARPADK
ncbi:MAG TPA: pitrilysin family protein [Kofleriaceae bacterium]|nr:pitrilysin family protein [Kofleriaceae bacterium]